MQRARDAALKFFIDLHLCPSLEDQKETELMIRKSAELGYRAVGIPLPKENYKDATERISEICDKTGLDFISRIDLEPSNTAELLNDLRRLRRKVEVISVKCMSKSVARQAAKDHRVDILSFSPLDVRKRFFDLAEAELASKTQVSFEIDMAPLLYLQGYRRIRLISKLREEVYIAKKRDVSIIISSGASEPKLLRKPKDLASLGYLFELDPDNAEKALSDNPRELIERNRRKLSSNHVAPGIYVVRRGKDCLS
ncbi:hypothetical protein DRO35_01460 [Candidatus Bathyarchaeota archaeon]|nr:MAG: hypothetical protein DRO35_01460 [Candidatus Bathyarchaeota archaeon]